MSQHFHPLRVAAIEPESDSAKVIRFELPPELREVFAFEPGQYLTLRATVGGEDLRRSYSICSSTQRFETQGEIEVGIKPVEGGVFSNWAAQPVAG